MNLMAGPRGWTQPHTIESRYQISVRPAIRRYNMERGFDNVRARFEEWLEPRIPDSLRDVSHPLDIRGVRVAYRALKRAYRFVDEILFSTERDFDWIVGGVLSVIVLAIGSLMVLSFWRAW